MRLVQPPLVEQVELIIASWFSSSSPLCLLPDTKKLLTCALSQLPFSMCAGPVLNEQWGWCGTLPQKKSVTADLGLR